MAVNSIPEQFLAACAAYYRTTACASIDTPPGEQREAHLADALTQTAEIATIPSLTALQALLSEASASQQTALRRLYAWGLMMYVRARLWPTQREIHVRQRTTTYLVDEEPIPFLASFAVMAAEKRRDRRAAIEAALCTQLEPINALLATRFQILGEIADTLEYPSPEAMVGTIASVDPAAQEEVALQLLRLTEEVYLDLLTWAGTRRLRLPPGQLKRHDMFALFTFEEYQKYYQPSALALGLKACVRDMGLDPQADGRLIWRERSAHFGPAEALAVQIPDEIVLSYAPIGGVQAADALASACGRALLWALTAPDLPLVSRVLGDAAIPMSNAQWLAETVAHPLWLRHYCAVTVDGNYNLWRRLDRLYRFRRQLGRFLYTRHLYTTASLAGAADAYREIMIDACHVDYPAEYYLLDVDWYYDTLTLMRGWSLAYALPGVLEQQITTDWFRCPDTGVWLRQYWASALMEEVDNLLQHFLGAPWEPSMLGSRLLDEQI